MPDFKSDFLPFDLAEAFLAVSFTIVVVLAAFCGAFFLTVVITFFPSLFGLTNWTFYGQLTVTAPRAVL
jgi:hypothetical protein